MTGGGSSDFFRFNIPTEGIDTIIDFSVIYDTIQVSATNFGSDLVAGAAITAAQFTLGAGATSGSQRFIYNQATGGLFFDTDGTGIAAQVQIAQLSVGLAMTNADIFAIT